MAGSITGRLSSHQSGFRRSFLPKMDRAVLSMVSRRRPQLSCLVSAAVWPSKSVTRDSAEFRDDRRRHLDAWEARALGVVEFLWPESYLTAHQAVIRVAVRAVVAAW